MNGQRSSFHRLAIIIRVKQSYSAKMLSDNDMMTKPSVAVPTVAHTPHGVPVEPPPYEQYNSALRQGGCCYP